MKTYKIPVVWQSIKTYEVGAENLQQAVTKALNNFMEEPDENYIEDSFQIDEVVGDEYPDEEYREIL